MKKILTAFFCSALLGACSSVGLKPACQGRGLHKPSYFAQGQTLAAFKFSAAARGNMLEGVLQIKKIKADSYDVTLFAASMGHRLMKAVVTPQGVAYSYLIKEADNTPARAKAERFLHMLLFPPSVYKGCKERDGLRIVSYKENGARYEYLAGETYPRALTAKKTLGSARMAYGEYTPYEEGEVPHYVFYQDGPAEAELVLITLKK